MKERLRPLRDQPVALAAFDPGLSGAVAFCESIGHGYRWSVEDLPTMGAAKQTILNGALLGQLLTRARVAHAVVEHVHAMPGQGVSSMFRFGTAFGQILGVLQALEISYELVQSAKWKRALGLAGGPGKGEVSRLRALTLFPALAGELARKKDHNRAEALLLARWKIYGGKP